MDPLVYLAQGFPTAASPLNLLYGFLGVLLGTLVGVLPGLGPAGAIALLLPLALHAPPLAYLIMLFGITYGAQYGGSTTSILVHIPGEASSVITRIHAHPTAPPWLVKAAPVRLSASLLSDRSSAAPSRFSAWRIWRRRSRNLAFTLARRNMPVSCCSV